MKQACVFKVACFCLAILLDPDLGNVRYFTNLIFYKQGGKMAEKHFGPRYGCNTHDIIKEIGTPNCLDFRIL